MKKGWSDRRRKTDRRMGDLPDVVVRPSFLEGELLRREKPRKNKKKSIVKRIMNKIIGMLIKRPRQWMASKSTTFIGVILILNAVGAIIMHLASGEAFDYSIVEKEWANIMAGIAGFGFLESKSNNTSSEEVAAANRKTATKRIAKPEKEMLGVEPVQPKDKE